MVGKMNETDQQHETYQQIVMAFLADAERAEAALQQLMDQDAPMGRLSLIGRASASGDDLLGVYYPTTGARMKGWGRVGAFWGGLWGLITGAAGFFVVPGVGPLLAAGPIVEALVSAAGGAIAVGGVLAGAGAASQLTVAVHRMGVPDEKLDETHERVARGEHLLMLIAPEGEIDHWQSLIETTGADPIWTFPYYGLKDAAQTAI